MCQNVRSATSSEALLLRSPARRARWKNALNPYLCANKLNWLLKAYCMLVVGFLWMFHGTHAGILINFAVECMLIYVFELVVDSTSSSDCRYLTTYNLYYPMQFIYHRLFISITRVAVTLRVETQLETADRETRRQSKACRLLLRIARLWTQISHKTAAMLLVIAGLNVCE